MPMGVYERSKEQCENISKGKMGSIPWNKGKTAETDPRIIENHKTQIGSKRPQVSLMAKEQMKIQRVGKTNEEIYGVERAKQISEKHSASSTGIPSKLKGKTLLEICNGDEEKLKNRIMKISTSVREKFKDPLVKRKLQLARMRNIKNNYGLAHPNYNRSACEIFKEFDSMNQTNGRYAMYGGGEYLIEDLGFFPDYINFSLKLIIEVDEDKHFLKDGSLRLEDKTRQDKIQNYYKDYTFLRFRDYEMDNILKIDIATLSNCIS
jgi:hypothetical protein